MDNTRELENKAAQYCARRETCESEIRVKLSQWGALPGQIDIIVDRLIENNFIDHQRYANAFVHDKWMFNKWGKTKIKYALLQKGIDEQTIDQALEQIPAQEYKQTLIRLLKNKLSNTKEQGLKLRQKLFNFALNKGYEYDIVNQALDEILKG